MGGESVEKVKSSSAKENVNAQELQIIKLMRELDYGQLVVSVKNGKNILFLVHFVKKNRRFVPHMIF